MHTTIKLPKPDERGNRTLSDGSIIYPSGKSYYRDNGATLVKMNDAGKFMLWIKDGDNVDESGIKRAYGHLVTTDVCPRYFVLPSDALAYLNGST